MTPALIPDKLIIASTLYWRLEPNDVVIIQHDGLEKIKRVKALNEERLFVLGDNAAHSTDSRHFGWLRRDQVLAKVLTRV